MEKEIKYPKFDDQKDVLNGVIDMLDQALAMIDINDKTALTNMTLILREICPNG